MNKMQTGQMDKLVRETDEDDRPKLPPMNPGETQADYVRRVQAQQMRDQ